MSHLHHIFPAVTLNARRQENSLLNCEGNRLCDPKILYLSKLPFIKTILRKYTSRTLLEQTSEKCVSEQYT